MIDINETMDSFLNLIRGKNEGDPFSRFKSWEYCHNAFQNVRGKQNREEEITEDDIDYLALHLSFYLASWGMYRGSSFILQRDYKSHKPIVRIVLKEEYDELWDFNPLDYVNNDAKLSEIAGLVETAYEDIETNGYGNPPERFTVGCDTTDTPNNNKPVSATLITKVLMGTFAACPAFDRFLIEGIKRYKAVKPNEFGRYTCFSKKMMEYLFKFYINHSTELEFDESVVHNYHYPPMKKVDMYFWEVGFEAGFMDSLIKTKEEKLDNGAINELSDTKTKNAFSRTLHQIKSFIPNALDYPGTDLEVINRLIGEISQRVS